MNSLFQDINESISVSVSESKFTNKKTKKNKNKNIWKIVDDEKENIKNNSDDCKNIDMACIYNSNVDELCECCEKCKALLAYTEEGFLVCTNDQCSVLYKNIIDQTAEWRFYGADDNQTSDPTRCGMPVNPLLPQSAFACTICPFNNNKKYNNGEMQKIRRHIEWQSMPYKEKALYEDFQLITTMASLSGISKAVIDTALVIHKKNSEFQTYRGKNRMGIIAASVYLACIKNNCPRTSKDIGNMFNIGDGVASKGCKNALKALNVYEKDMCENEKLNLKKITAKEFIDRYCSTLKIDEELKNLCKFIEAKTTILMSENTPTSLAAGIIYFVIRKLNLDISKYEVHKASNISEVTIIKCCNKLEEHNNTKSIIPKAILTKYGIA